MYRNGESSTDDIGSGLGLLPVFQVTSGLAAGHLSELRSRQTS